MFSQQKTKKNMDFNGFAPATLALGPLGPWRALGSPTPLVPKGFSTLRSFTKCLWQQEMDHDDPRVLSARHFKIDMFSMIFPSSNMIKQFQHEHADAWISCRFRKKSESNGACASDCRAAFKKHLERVTTGTKKTPRWISIDVQQRRINIHQYPLVQYQLESTRLNQIHLVSIDQSTWYNGY